MINIDDYAKIEIRIGEIISAEKIEGADKLLKLSVNFGEETVRQIVSGIALHFQNPADLVGVKCAFVVNLEPRTIRGFESQGMILAGSNEEGAFTLLKADNSVPAGIKVK